MVSRPRVSAIIVSYNRADDLKLCIQALLDTGYPNLEIVVVDNASKDGSADAAASFPQVKLIRSADNLGFAEGCNVGLRQSTGDYIALINNDALVATDWFDRLVDFLEAHPKAAAAGGKIYDWNEDNPLGSHSNDYHAWVELSPNTGFVHVAKNVPDQIREVPTLQGACVLIRRATIDQLGEPFLEPVFFTYYEETDFFVRAKRRGWQLFYTGAPAAWHRIRASSTPYHYLHHMERNRVLFAFRNFSDEALVVALAATLWRAIESVVEQFILRKPVLKPRSDAWRWLFANRALLKAHRERCAPHAT
jgi:GT2 family glycosyltransferase